MFLARAAPDRLGVRPLDPDRVLAWVGGAVAAKRRSFGLTQEELAERLSVSVKYLQRVEAGAENLTLRSLVSLANGLSMPLGSLVQRPRNAITRRPGRPKKR